LKNIGFRKSETAQNYSCLKKNSHTNYSRFRYLLANTFTHKKEKSDQ